MSKVPATPPGKRRSQEARFKPSRSILSTFLHPDLTLRLILVVLYFLLTGISNLFGLYDALVVNQDASSLWVPLCAALLYLPAGLALARLREWGRKLALAVCGLAIIVAVPVLFFLGAYLGAGLTLLLNALILRYLLSAECRRLFAR